MSQVRESELSLLGTQLVALQSLLERRLTEERETRQQTMVGLERWISERLAERDRAVEHGLEAARQGDVPSSSVRHQPAPTAGVDPADLAPSPQRAIEELSAAVHALRARVDAIAAQTSFMHARQDEFALLLTTVREWIVTNG